MHDKKTILSFFKGPAGKGRRAAFQAAFRAATADSPFGAAFTRAVAHALNTALAGVDGWVPTLSLNTNTADAVAGALDR